MVFYILPTYWAVPSVPLPPPSPPPAYSPQLAATFFREMNSSLWQRLGLEAILNIECDPTCQMTAKFTAAVDALKKKLALQTDRPNLPDLNIMLVDRDGMDFSLSELPLPWLQVPELVTAIRTISHRNNEGTLKTLSNQLLELRKLVELLQNSPTAGHLRRALKQMDEDTELNSVRVNDQDLIEVYLQYNDGYEPLQVLYDEGKLICKEQHLVVSLKGGGRGTTSTYRIYAIAHRLSEAGVPATLLETPFGNLIDWALMHDADYFTIGALAKGLYRYSSPVSLSNLLISLHLPLGQQRGKYDSWPGWDTDIPVVLASCLKDQGVNVAEIETEYGSLVDYAMSVQNPRYWVIKNLYDTIHIDATIPQLERAIELSADGGDETLPLAVIWKLQEQGVDLTSFRNEAGETLAQYGYRLGVPERTLSILYYLGNSAKRPPDDFYQLLPVEFAESLDFQTPDIRQYQNALDNLLTSLSYSTENTLRDGDCFYSALGAMYAVSKSDLKQKMLLFLKTILKLVQQNRLLDPIQQMILDSMGDVGIQLAINNITQNQWGQQSYLPLVAATLFQFFEVPSGIYTLTPDSDSHPVITLYNPDGSVESLTHIGAEIPVLVYNGVDHWTYATPSGSLFSDIHLVNETESENEIDISIQRTNRLMPAISQ